MRLPAGGLALIIFGTTLLSATCAAALLFRLMGSRTKAERLNLAHALFVCILAAPFFVWSIILNMEHVDSGVVVFPLAIIGAAFQVLLKYRFKKWVTFICCLVPALAYVGGLVVYKAALLRVYSSLAATIWMVLAVVGYCIVSHFGALCSSEEATSSHPFLEETVRPSDQRR